MTVIGLDLSLTGTGISDGLHTWTVKSRGQADDDLDQRRRRLQQLATAIVNATTQASDGLGPILVVIEQPAYSKQAGHTHDRSGLWWLVVQQLATLGHHVAEVSPSTLKKYATGKGNAGKDAMVDATARRLPHIDTGGGDNNRCDALWLAAMGHDHLDHALTDIPAHNRTALTAVRWPKQEAA